MNTMISLQIPIELVDQLVQEAQEKEMSLSGYIRLILKHRSK